MLPSMDNRSWVAYLLTVHSARNFPKALVRPLIHSRTADLDLGAHEGKSSPTCKIKFRLFCLRLYRFLRSLWLATCSVLRSSRWWELFCVGPSLRGSSLSMASRGSMRPSKLLNRLYLCLVSMWRLRVLYLSFCLSKSCCHFSHSLWALVAWWTRTKATADGTGYRWWFSTSHRACSWCY